MAGIKYCCIVLFVALSMTSKAQTTQIDTFLLSQIKTYHIPALSVAIIENGKVVLTKTYGKANLEYNIPNTENWRP